MTGTKKKLQISEENGLDPPPPPPPPLSNENNFVLADFFSELDNGHVSSKKMCLY